MKKGWTLFIALLCWMTLMAEASAHRLDEYLQATTITLTRDHLQLQLRLTPGVAVAPQVLASIGAGSSIGNGDGGASIAPALQQNYAQQVLRDLSLNVDGKAWPPRLMSMSFPSTNAIRNGEGEIRLMLEADLPATGGEHRLIYENRHRRDISVYLVNSLLPHDRDTHILAQDRNIDQSFYQLDFATRPLAGQPRPAASQQSWQSQDARAVLAAFFGHGIHHILTGYDHLLFACALLLATATLWDLLKVVTAFTLAHSITLTLAALHLVHLPASVVEPLIAVSIIFGALQNIFWPGSARGRSRLAVAFFFGLFHGLGFAGGLLDIMHQMPGTIILLAIVGFSLGVEAGHQIVMLPLFALLKLLRNVQLDVQRNVQRKVAASAQLASTWQRLASSAIALMGLYYLGAALTGAG